MFGSSLSLGSRSWRRPLPGFGSGWSWGFLGRVGVLCVVGLGCFGVLCVVGPCGWLGFGASCLVERQRCKYRWQQKRRAPRLETQPTTLALLTLALALLFFAPCAFAVGAETAPPEGVSPQQHAEISALLAEFMAGCVYRGIVSLAARLLQIFADLNWLRVEQIPIDSIGTDPKNRNGLGVVVQDVYDLGADIFRAGWSDKECLQALCVEEAPLKTDVVDFSSEVVRQSNGMLPPVCREQVRFGALACNHTVLFLRCVKHGMPCGERGGLKAIARHGKLCLDMLAQLDPNFALRVREGMKFQILHWFVRVHYPQALELLSEAANTGGQLARRENVFQVLLRMWTLASASHGNPEWIRILETVKRTNPPCTGYLPKLIPWVVGCSGDEETGWALHWMVRMYRASSLSAETGHREIDQELWEQLGGATIHPPVPAVKSAIMLFNITGAPSTVKSGVCRLVNAGDVAILRKPANLPRVLLCETVLKKIIDIQTRVDDLCAKRHAGCRPLGGSGSSSSGQASSLQPVMKLDGTVEEGDGAPTTLEAVCLEAARRIAAVALGKKLQGQQFKTAKGVGWSVLKEMHEVCPRELADTLRFFPETLTWTAEMENPGGDKGKAGEAKAVLNVPIQKSALAQDASASADALAALLHKGFNLGHHVRSQKEKDLWEISHIDSPDGEDRVVLKLLPNRDVIKACTVAEFFQLFSRPPAGYVDTLLHPWKELSSCLAEQSMNWKTLLAKAQIISSLQSVQALYPDKEAPVSFMLNLQDQPKHLAAEAYCQERKLLLAPLTFNIKLVDARERKKAAAEKREGPPSLYQVTWHDGVGRNSDWEWFLLPPIFKDLESKGSGDNVKDEEVKKVALFWQVSETADKDKVNVRLESVKTSLLSHVTAEPESIQSHRRKSTKQGLQADAASPNVSKSAGQAVVEIPVLINCKDLMAGDELFVYKKKDKKGETDAAPLDTRKLTGQLFDANKRQKVR